MKTTATEKSIILSQIMKRAWIIYYTIAGGGHREKLSTALKRAWQEFKAAAAPVQEIPEFNENEITVIHYPQGKMTVPMNFLIHRSKSSRDTKQLLKLCKISDDRFKTSILDSWIKGLDYLQAIAKKKKSL